MFYTKKKLIILIIISIIFFILTYIDVRSENINKITGFAKVVDGDTIKINSKKIRLYGIDAPEKKQKCKKTYLTISFMSFTKDYMCGEVSTQKLIKKINKQKLNCNILDVDRYKRLIGECFKRNINLNSWMVSNGYAVAYRKYSKKYVSDEINAKNNKTPISIEKSEIKIKLLCYPRILGYVFNPLSIFFVYDENDYLISILYEVKNTFGEQHTYVFKTSSYNSNVENNCEKKFYVSPFMDLSSKYFFKILDPNKKLSIIINQIDNQGKLLYASQNGIK